MRDHHTSLSTVNALQAPPAPLVLTSKVLDDARTFFEDRGTFGLEGTAMIKAGKSLDLVVPRQNARRDAYGHVNVEVPREGQIPRPPVEEPDPDRSIDWAYVQIADTHPKDQAARIGIGGSGLSPTHHSAEPIASPTSAAPSPASSEIATLRTA